MRKYVKKPILALLHNLGMVLFLFLIASNKSPANQIVLSVVAVVYWMPGYLMIYK